MTQSRSRTAPKLHVILTLHGEREGEKTLQVARTYLLHGLSDLLVRLGGEQTPHGVSILLEPGTIMLEDVASLRPELVLAVAANSVIQRFRINPWYARPEPLLAGGEALVRDLALARTDAEHHGLALSQVAMLPHTVQFPAQMPQILAGFRIPAVLLPPGSRSLGLPFCWQSPDGSGVLVVSQEDSTDAAAAVESQRSAQPDGPFLWMLNTDGFFPSMDVLEEDLALPVQYSNLEAYVEAVRSSFPDELRPVLNGALQTSLTPDGASAGARVRFKQAVTALAQRLLWQVEPLLTLALAHSTLPYPENAFALLQQSWRWLLQNQARAVISGAVSDPTQADAEQRNRHIAEYADWVVERALDALPGEVLHVTALNDSAETYFVVWNGQGQRVVQAVALLVVLPEGRYPAALVAPNGDDVPFTWDSASREVRFLATAASVGYTTYTLKLSQEQDVSAISLVKRSGSSISRGMSALSLEDSVLTWTVNERPFTNLLRYEDGGDAGDVWQYRKPAPDVVVPGSVVGTPEVESTPWMERLRFQHRLRIAPGLQDGKSRTRGVRVLDILTTATLYQDQPGLHLHITFDNTAQDHRLRAYLRTGIAPQRLYIDDVYGLRRLEISADALPGSLLVPGILALYDGERGFALCSRVPFQADPLLEDGQVTLAITLLRAVGWLSRDTGEAAVGTQSLGEHALDFWLVPLNSKHDPIRLLQLAQQYRAPLLVRQYEQALDYQQYSFIQVQHALLVALKPSRRMPGIIARLLNPTDEEQQVIVLHGGLVRQAQLLNLAEEPVAGCPVVGNRVLLTMKPHEVSTVWLDVM